jgi:hypothetical protein
MTVPAIRRGRREIFKVAPNNCLQKEHLAEVFLPLDCLNLKESS